MFTVIGVKINLNQFVDVCKKLFVNFDSDLIKYTPKWVKDNNGEDKTHCLIDFLSDHANHYFRTINFNKDNDNITIFKFDNETIVFGISLLTCEKELIKSISLNEVNVCMEDLKTLIKHFNLDETNIEFIVDNI
jgi:hypothetical protein